MRGRLDEVSRTLSREARGLVLEEKVLLSKHTVLGKKIVYIVRIHFVPPCGVIWIDFGLLPSPELENMLSVPHIMKELGNPLPRLYIYSDPSCLSLNYYAPINRLDGVHTADHILWRGGCKGIWGCATGCDVLRSPFSRDGTFSPTIGEKSWSFQKKRSSSTLEHHRLQTADISIVNLLRAPDLHPSCPIALRSPPY